MDANPVKGLVAGQFRPGYALKDDNGKPINPFVKQNRSTRHVDGQLVVPPPDQVSEGENIPCVTVFKVSAPDDLLWRASDSFTFLTIDDPDEKISWDIVRNQQPRQRTFQVRTSTIAEDLDHMYFLIENVQFPAAGTFKLQFRVMVRTQYSFKEDPITRNLEQKEHPLPDDVWRMAGGQPENPQQGGFYVAGHFELKEPVQVKEGKDVKRLNPLTPEQQAIVDRLVAHRVVQFPPEQAQ
ncbi:hypothetical protein QBC45DRAFT_467449 [Copromyces sp. CBS 386.78]|nr:hypothetical protein QBC45DRAFT_467449 [Copromyces sp. CBS 386.78]